MERLAQLSAHVEAASSPPLTAEQLRAFEADGVVVLRGFFSEVELARISTPVLQAQQAPGSPMLDGGSGTKHNYPDMRCLEEHPDLALASLDHPRVVAAVETLLGDEAEVQQYGILTWRPEAAGFGAHYDYKPVRVVGSSLHWLFAVIPLTDYNEHDGPLLVSPGSSAKTTVLARVAPERIHSVDTAQIPPELPAQRTLNPQLRRGDLLLSSCFTWHLASGNRPPSTGRTGLYMKFRAASAPCSTGPLLFPSSVAAAIQHKHLLPHHRADGTQTIDSVCLVLEEHGGGRVWAVQRPGDGGWCLPTFDIASSAQMQARDTSAWDSSNVIGEVLAAVKEALGLELGWLSWIADEKTIGSPRDTEHLQRVYGHTMPAGWTSTTGGFVDLMGVPSGSRTWIKCWQRSEDRSGKSVRRGLGLARDGVGQGYNSEGVAEGKYRVAPFAGPLPPPNPLARQ